jgi:hypothetical protein
VLYEIDGFVSFIEYERFVSYINNALNKKELIEIIPKSPYFPNADLSKQERWFIDTTDDTVWRLVPPDFPFAGLFMRVDYC